MAAMSPQQWTGQTGPLFGGEYLASFGSIFAASDDARGGYQPVPQIVELAA